MKPKILKRGDTVGIVSPSGLVFEEGDINSTFQWLSKLGLKWKLGKHVFDQYGDLAGHDQDRLDDFHSLWADPQIAAVMPLRGGNGAVRLLPKLNFQLIKENPKILVGYSDITGLLIPIHQQTGLVTFHGPTAGSFFDGPFTFTSFQKALMSSKPIGLVVEPPKENPWGSQYGYMRLAIAEGKAKGRLTGGCLTVVKQLMGTAYEIETKGKIVFLEDVSEEPFSIDRMLTQLLLAKKLQKAAAIIIGECTFCRPGESRRRTLIKNMSVEKVLRDRLGNLGIPVAYGMHFGHSKQKFTLPIGVMSSLEVTSSGCRFEIEESALTLK